MSKESSNWDFLLISPNPIILPLFTAIKTITSTHPSISTTISTTTITNTSTTPAPSSTPLLNTSKTDTPLKTEKLHVNNSGKGPETIKLDNACFITFQAEPLANRPSHHKAPFELKLDVESIEVCAIRCYQDGCTGAIFNKTSNTCELSYDDKYFCSSAPIISRFAHLANLRHLNVLWIHCVNCRMFLIFLIN
ncbi:unnamed protein product [Meloidogyne enterolobii]|uniref:Uncharacterized protein n=1 Tax=Meloidogyne enterolobii TaxID=390850 RepID=A0ACB0XXS0_MELEN